MVFPFFMRYWKLEILKVHATVEGNSLYLIDVVLTINFPSVYFQGNFLSVPNNMIVELFEGFDISSTTWSLGHSKLIAYRLFLFVV